MYMYFLPTNRFTIWISSIKHFGPCFHHYQTLNRRLRLCPYKERMWLWLSEMISCIISCSMRGRKKLLIIEWEVLGCKSEIRLHAHVRVTGALHVWLKQFSTHNTDLWLFFYSTLWIKTTETTFSIGRKKTATKLHSSLVMTIWWGKIYNLKLLNIYKYIILHCQSF